MKFIKPISILILLLVTTLSYSQVRFEAKSDNETFKDKVFITTELDKTNFSISDVIIVTYRLFVSHDIGIEGWNEAYKPVYDNFEKKDLDLNNINIEMKNFKGKAYRTVVFKEVILRPNKKGHLMLPKYGLNVEVSIPSKTEKNEYGRFKMEKQNVTIKTDEIKITVK